MPETAKVWECLREGNRAVAGVVIVGACCEEITIVKKGKYIDEKISTVMDTMIAGWKCNESHLIEWLMGDFDLPPDGHQIISD